MSKQATKQAPLAGDNPIVGILLLAALPQEPRCLPPSLKFALLLTIACHSWLVVPADGLDTLNPDQWRTASQFFDQLEAPVSVDWQDNPLFGAITRLALSQRTAIFLDRRIDPNQKISLQADNQSLRDVLDQLATQIDAGVGFVDSVIYLGPRFTAERLATVAEMQNQLVRKLPKDEQSSLLRKRATLWPRLSEPLTLIDKLTHEVGRAVDNPEVVFHDLWPEYSLPPLTFGERMTLLLAGFRMSFRLLPDGKSIQLTRFPKTVFIEKEYPAGSDAGERAKQLGELLPQAFIEVRGERVLVRSMLEDHWAIQRQQFRSRPQLPKQSKAADKRYSLTVKTQPARALLKTLASRLAMSIEFADDIDEQLEQRVSFAVTNVSAEELFEAAAKPAGLAVKIEGETVTIYAESR